MAAEQDLSERGIDQGTSGASARMETGLTYFIPADS